MENYIVTVWIGHEQSKMSADTNEMHGTSYRVKTALQKNLAYKLTSTGSLDNFFYLVSQIPVFNYRQYLLSVAIHYKLVYAYKLVYF